MLTINYLFFHRKLKLSDTKVRCGELDATSDDEEKPPQDRQARHISIHPAFNAKNLYYDFALVHVATDFELDEHISPICLPDQFQPLQSFNNDECYVMGYGKDRSGKVHNQELLELIRVVFNYCIRYHFDSYFC